MKIDHVILANMDALFVILMELVMNVLQILYSVDLHVLAQVNLAQMVIMLILTLVNVYLVIRVVLPVVDHPIPNVNLVLKEISIPANFNHAIFIVEMVIMLINYLEIAIRAALHAKIVFLHHNVLHVFQDFSYTKNLTNV